MKKIFIMILLCIFLCFGGNVKAASPSGTQPQTYSATKYNLILDCADGYTEDEFWGCVKDGDLIKCGDINIPSPISPITRIIVMIIKIAVPLVLIITGMIDIVKAVTASDEKKIKESQTKFVKRLIPAALIFLVVTIVQLLVGIVADNATESGTLSNCIDCMISDKNACGIDKTGND